VQDKMPLWLFLRVDFIPNYWSGVARTSETATWEAAVAKTSKAIGQQLAVGVFSKLVVPKITEIISHIIQHLLSTQFISLNICMQEYFFSMVLRLQHCVSAVLRFMHSSYFSCFPQLN
jgi:hypothetical protein